MKRTAALLKDEGVEMFQGLRGRTIKEGEYS
jgi:hypothetical protein